MLLWLNVYEKTINNKAKIVPVLNEVLCHEGIGGGGIEPEYCIMWVVSFTFGLIYPQGNSFYVSIE